MPQGSDEALKGEPGRMQILRDGEGSILGDRDLPREQRPRGKKPRASCEDSKTIHD